MVAVLKNGKIIRGGALEDCASGFLAEWFSPRLASLKTSTDFVERVQKGRKRNADQLHQWAIFGGQTVGATEDINAWTGYFELCLRFSTLP